MKEVENLYIFRPVFIPKAGGGLRPISIAE
jgi:hypothetical protein